MLSRAVKQAERYASLSDCSPVRRYLRSSRRRCCLAWRASSDRWRLSCWPQRRRPVRSVASSGRSAVVGLGVTWAAVLLAIYQRVRRCCTQLRSSIRCCVCEPVCTVSEYAHRGWAFQILTVCDPLDTGHVIRRMRSGRVRIFNGNQWEPL